LREPFLMPPLGVPPDPMDIDTWYD